MKVAILEARAGPGASKDTAGGFGSRFPAGRSLFSRLASAAKAGIRYPSPTLAYLAAIFRRGGHDVKILDREIPGLGTDLAIIPSSSIGWKGERRLGQEIRMRRPGCRVAYVMPFSAQFPRTFLDSGAADLVIDGEPEDAAIRMSRSGRIPRGVVRSRPLDPERLPFPDWQGFPIQSYSYFPGLWRKPLLDVLSSRGCPYGCGYCPYKSMWGAWRARSAESVVSEIAGLRERHSVRSVMFRDICFSADRSRARDVCEALVSAGLSSQIEWGCETRPDLLDGGLLQAMRGAGMRELEVGFESSDAKLLASKGRLPVKEKTILDLSAECRRLGIRLAVFYVLGMPGQTEEDVKRVVRFSRTVNSFAAQFTLYTPFPGTPLFGADGKGVLELNSERFDCFTPVASYGISPDRLSALWDEAQGGYFARAGWPLPNWRCFLP